MASSPGVDRAGRVMRVAVVGIGAIGGWVAAMLAGSGHAVCGLARGATLAAVRERGLVLDAGGGRARHAVAVADDAAALGRQDLVVIAVKGPAVAAAALAARPLLGPDTLVLPMVNGVPYWFRLPGDATPLAAIDPGGAIARTLPLARTIGAVVHAAAAASAPGHLVLHRADRLILGEIGGGASARVDALRDVFAAAGIPCVESPALMREAWYKLWGNMTMNPISALTRATTDRILDDPLVARFVLDIMAEAARIGDAIGCSIAETGETRNAVTRALGPIRTSMLQDLEAGRALEIDALLAAPVEIARRLGIATPAMDALLGLTRLLGRSAGLYTTG